MPVVLWYFGGRVNCRAIRSLKKISMIAFIFWKKIDFLINKCKFIEKIISVFFQGNFLSPASCIPYISRTYFTAPMKKQDLLRKYLEGKCSEKELQRLYAYLQEDAADEYSEVLYDIWSRLERKRAIDEQTTERIFGKIKSDIIQTHGKKKGVPAIGLYKDLRRPVFIRMAAAVTVLLIASALLYRFFLYEPMITIGTGYGKTNKLILPEWIGGLSLCQFKNKIFGRLDFI